MRDQIRSAIRGSGGAWVAGFVRPGRIPRPPATGPFESVGCAGGTVEGSPQRKPAGGQKPSATLANMPDLPKVYDPHEVEDRLYRFWEEGGYFGAEPNPEKTPFTIVMPPPNITGALHLGHGLDETPQDILVRWRRMQGDETLWVPGTDHAGIATQNVVERELAKEGVSRQDLGREGFVARVWEWREQYGTRIIGQLKRLGCSCDWERVRFTMDPGLSRAVRKVFVDLFDEGLIYRGNRIINWCPRCGTAIADVELDHSEHDGELVEFRYPLE